MRIGELGAMITSSIIAKVSCDNLIGKELSNFQLRFKILKLFHLLFPYLSFIIYC